MGYTENQLKQSPFFSIVIVSLNAGEELVKTVSSVLEQTFRDYEIIIKDAGSTDGSLEMLPCDARIRKIICADTGLYHAMNQATRKAKGKYIYYLNCGDYLYDENVLQRVYDFDASAVQSSNCVLYGESFYRNFQRMRIPPKKITSYFWSISNICHQAAFFSRNSLRQPEAYDLSYRVSGDNELMVFQFKNGISFISMGFPVCSYEGGGYSETEKGMEIGMREHKRIMKNYFHGWERVYFLAEHIIQYLWRKIRRRK